MRTLTFVIAAAAGSVSLAACDRTGQADKVAGKTAGSPVAASKEAVPPRPAESFKSVVTGKHTPGTPQAADAELSSKVKSALKEAPDIKTAGLEVASADGVVTLYGTVDAPVEKDRAAMLVMEVEGVRSVVNNLIVVKGS